MDPKNIPFIALIVGPTNSGRSQYLVRQLRGPFRGKFDHMVLICPTCVHKKNKELWAKIDRLVICKMSSSSFTCTASTQTVVLKVKHVHPLFSDLLDLAIYSFGFQCGLRAHHKVRGGSVLEGVSAILGRMLLNRNPETKAVFEEMTPTRLGS